MGYEVAADRRSPADKLLDNGDEWSIRDTILLLVLVLVLATSTNDAQRTRSSTGWAFMKVKIVYQYFSVFRARRLYVHRGNEQNTTIGIRLSDIR